MRQSITLFVIILAGLVLYTAYGLFTYKEQRAAPFVFADPVLPPELQAQVDAAKAEAEAIRMTPEQEQQTAAAIAQISQAVNLYQTYEGNAAPQAVSTFETLNTAVLNRRLPAYLLGMPALTTRQRSFELITIDPNKNVSIGGGSDVVSCIKGSTVFDLVTGDNGDNRLECDAPAPQTPLDRMFLGGPGNDTIVSAFGNRIINAGTGDDTITAGPGRTIIILDDAWGQDTLTIDCAKSRVMPPEIPAGFPVPWSDPFINFIVLGPSLNITDITWNGLVLTNKVTGDTLSVNENCFNLVAAGN